MTDTLTTFLLSPRPSYNYKNGSGQSQEVNGVDRGGANIYCLENDTKATLFGNMSDATILSQEACEAKVQDVEAGRIPSNFAEQWGLDLPEGMAPNLPDAREQAKEMNISAIDRLQPKGQTPSKPSK